MGIKRQFPNRVKWPRHYKTTHLYLVRKLKMIGAAVTVPVCLHGRQAEHFTFTLTFTLLTKDVVSSCIWL
jgi:hypothetical protein